MTTSTPDRDRPHRLVIAVGATTITRTHETRASANEARLRLQRDIEGNLGTVSRFDDDGTEHYFLATNVDTWHIEPAPNHTDSREGQRP